MKHKSHSFNTELAALIGLKEAIILSHIYFWYEQNKANGTNFFDGKYWTFNSVKAFAEQFEYLSEKEIRGALGRLNELGYTIEGNYNKLPIDKTKWYSLSEIALKMLEEDSIAQKGKWFIQKGKWIAQKGEPLPDINTDIENNSNKDERNVVFENFWNYYKKGSKKLARERFMKLSDADLEKMRKHLPVYFKATPDAKFRKDAERYLSNRLWENDDVAELSAKITLPTNWYQIELTPQQWALLTKEQAQSKKLNDLRKQMGV